MDKLVKRPKRRDSYAALDRGLNAALQRRSKESPLRPPAGLRARRQAPPGRAGRLVRERPPGASPRGPAANLNAARVRRTRGLTGLARIDHPDMPWQ